MVEKLSEEVVAEMKEAFSIFEKEGGYMNTSDLGTGMRSLGYNLTEAEIAEMVSEIDPEGKGTIDLAKFMHIAAKKILESDPEEELLEAFRVFDSDANGFISPAELRLVMANLGEKLTDEEIDEMFKEADANEDGEMDYDEFVKIMISRF